MAKPGRDRVSCHHMRESIEGMVGHLGVPGIQCVVVDAERSLFEHAGGWADVAGRKRMEPDTTTMLYSMTKTFTAAAVLQLVEAGEVDLDAPFRHYVPNTPYGDAVTIRHLLSQTSGIPNPVPLKWVHLAAEHPQFDEHAALDAVLKVHGKLDFAPGTKYGYSNIAYWILGRVIEQVSDMTFDAYMEKNIFGRLGLHSSEIGFVVPTPAHHAKGYIPKYSFMNLIKSLLMERRFFGSYEGRWFHIKDHYLNGPACGGLVASGRAVAVFLQDQLKARSVLFGREMKGLFYQQQKNNRGKPVPMTLGWHVGRAKGKHYFYKEGGGGGFHGEMRIYKDTGIAAVAVANDATFRAGNFLDRICRDFLR